MRSKVRVLLVPFLLLAAVRPAFVEAKTPPVRVAVGDMALRLPSSRQPFLENGVTMVPLNSVLKAAGIRVTGDSGSFAAQTACHSVNLQSGGAELTVDGERRPMPVAARKVNGELYAPLRPVAEALGLAVEWDDEQSTAVLLPGNVRYQETVTLPAHSQAVSDLCRYPNLTQLILQQGEDDASNLMQVAVHQAPLLRNLKLTNAGELTAEPDTQTTDLMPYRVETPHGVFLGDKGMKMSAVTQYAADFEGNLLRELERDTGLHPTERKPVILLYGDQDQWNAATSNSPYWGFYTAQEHRIYMAHWRSPEVVNSLLLTHEMFHWLAWEEGKVSLPTWLNEGLAHNLSWRVQQHTDSWLNPYVRREWLRVTGAASQSVPELASHTAQDEYTITAAALLLQTRGRDALVPFFELTRSGKAFSEAFQQAFRVTPAEFEAEYRQQVAVQRKAKA